MLEPGSSSAQDDTPTNLTAALGWCRRHFVATTCIAMVAFYFIGFRLYYCVKEGCTHPADWWFHLPAEAQAIWVGSLATVVTVWWAVILFRQDRREKDEVQRTAAQPAVYQLISELEVIQASFNKLPLVHPQAA